MKIRNEKQLKKLLSNAEEEDVPTILKHWLHNVGWGTNVEAFRLIQFIKLWDKQFNVKMKSRDKRTAMIKAGITHSILAHFSGLERKGKTFQVHSMELLPYLGYGPGGMPRTQVTNDRLNDQIVQDSLTLSNSNEVESIRKASKRLDADRTTVRGNRRKEEYSQSLDINVHVLDKLKEKHKF